jgi:hypothetical protein
VPPDIVAEPLENRSLDAPKGVPPVAEELQQTDERQPPKRQLVRELPSPPKFSMKPEDFFEYWAKMDKKYPSRLLLYVYRMWPVIDRTLADPNAKKNIGKVDAAWDPANWRQEMLHCYGSGDYKLALTDGALSKSIGQTIVMNLRDSEYPPAVPPDELVMDDPANRSHIEWLRIKGKLDQGEDVANTETVDKLASALIEQSKQSSKAAAEAAAAKPGEAASVVKETADLIGQAARTSHEMLKNTYQEMETIRKAQTDPAAGLTMIQQLFALMKSLAPTPADATQPAAAGFMAELTKIVDSAAAREAKLNGTILELMRGQLQSMEARLQQSQTQPAQGANPQRGLKESLQELVDVKDTLRDILGVGSEGDEGSSGGRPRNVPWWAGIAENLATGLPNAIAAATYNIALAKGVPGAPTPGVGALPAGQPTQPMMPNTPANNPNPGDAAMSMYAEFLQKLEVPLIRHLNEGLSGADFASAMTAWYGDLAYQQIRALGTDSIVALLNSHPPIAKVIAQIPDKFAAFLDQFMRAEEIWAAEEGQDDQPGGDPSPKKAPRAQRGPQPV